MICSWVPLLSLFPPQIVIFLSKDFFLQVYLIQKAKVLFLLPKEKIRNAIGYD